MIADQNFYDTCFTIFYPMASAMAYGRRPKFVRAKHTAMAEGENCAYGPTLIFDINSRVSNIESDNSQNVVLEDYNNISDRIFPHFTTPSTLVTQPMLQLRTILTELRWLQRPITQRWSFQPTSIYEMLSCIPPTYAILVFSKNIVRK